jgi:predicted CopG family antitoxin
MASKTIMIQEDTYKKLLRLKQGNESFNDIILRLIYQKQDFRPYFGLFSKEGDEIEEAITESQKANDLADIEREEDF